MDWRIKGVIQKALCAVPGGVRINDLLQRTVGGLRHFDVSVAGKVDDWVIHMDHMRTINMPIAGKRVFEIGTGWFPTLPLCYALAGAGSCVTVDLNPHLSSRLSFRLLRALGEHLDVIAGAAGCGRVEVENRYLHYTRARDLPDLLARAGIEYFAPADATQSGLPADSIDVVLSNSVLEHVPAAVLTAMMRESFRILRPGGIISHSVNCGDHYAYFDDRIDFMNYLRFSEAEWAFWNNDIQYQNRLRPHHFVNATNEAGFDIQVCIHQARPELLEALPKMKVAPEFSHLPPEELACRSIDIVAAKPASGDGSAAASPSREGAD